MIFVLLHQMAENDPQGSVVTTLCEQSLACFFKSYQNSTRFSGFEVVLQERCSLHKSTIKNFS